MGVRVDETGRRWVRAEIETPGTLEEVWNAISTDGGLSSWFTRSEFEKGSDGKPVRLVIDFGMGMDSRATITAWNPPRGFSVKSDEFIPGGPEVASEWRVEEGEGSSYVVSVEHSLFDGSDAYDGHIEATEAGWPAFFSILRLYMTHYPGQPSALLEWMGSVGDNSGVWERLSTALGFSGLAPGDRFEAAGGGMKLAGNVLTVPDETEIILHIDEPTGGAAHIFLWPVEGNVLMSVRFYLYGADAAEVVTREAPRWRSWMEALFPGATDGKVILEPDYIPAPEPLGNGQDSAGAQCAIYRLLRSSGPGGAEWTLRGLSKAGAR